LAIPTRTDAAPYSIYVINEALPKAHRREIINYMKKNFADHFDGKDTQREGDVILKAAEEHAEEVENYFIKTHYHEEKVPLFDFDINLNEND
jgi:hypothetical protein